EAADAQLEAFAAASWPPEGGEEIDIGSLYDRLAEAGYEYGPAFQGLRRAYRAGGAWFAEVALDGEADGNGFHLHPALSDAALHALLLDAFDGRESDAPPKVPFTFSGVHLEHPGAASLRVRLEAGDGGDGEGGPTTIRLQALDESGTPALAV